MRLLLAEDEKDLSDAVRKILERSGYTVDAAYDGEEALAFAGSADYDGIVLDVMMPKKDGFAVVKELRKKGNGVPVLILTAKAETDDKVLGLDSGADDGGNVLASMTATKSYASVAISCPSLTTGNTYPLTAGTFSQTISLSSLVYGGNPGGGFRP